MSIIVLPETREAWLQERKYGLGASDAGTIIGVNPWKTNVQLWEEKTKVLDPEDISHKPYVQFGHDSEPHIRALFALDHPELKVTYDSPYKIIRNDKYPFIFCTPDGEIEELYTGRRGGLEIKTTEIRNQSQWAEWDNRIPDQYYCQVIWQMIAADWEFVWLKVRIKWYTKDGDMRISVKEYKIERDDVPEDIEYIRSKGIHFWELVSKDQKPALILPQI